MRVVYEWVLVERVRFGCVEMGREDGLGGEIVESCVFYWRWCSDWR